MFKPIVLSLPIFSCLCFLHDFFFPTWWNVSCLRALQEGDSDEFLRKLKHSKEVRLVSQFVSICIVLDIIWPIDTHFFIFFQFKELVWSVSLASEESTEFIYSTIIKFQVPQYCYTTDMDILACGSFLYPKRQSVIFFHIIGFGFVSYYCALIESSFQEIFFWVKWPGHGCLSLKTIPHAIKNITGQFGSLWKAKMPIKLVLLFARCFCLFVS